MDIIKFKATLKTALEERCMTQESLASAINISGRHLSRVITGKSRLTNELLEKVANALKLPVSYFTDEDDDVSDMYFPVPLREAGGGLGGRMATGSKRIISYISLRKDFLLTKTSNLEALSFIHAQGDSMAPTIPDGAAVLIDESQIEPVNGKIFYIMFNNDLLIKRLSVENGKVVSLISDGWNRADKLEENDDLQILGKAILQQTLL